MRDEYVRDGQGRKAAALRWRITRHKQGEPADMGSSIGIEIESMLISMRRSGRHSLRFRAALTGGRFARRMRVPGLFAGSTAGRAGDLVTPGFQEDRG
jgi:hypothetical protein